MATFDWNDGIFGLGLASLWGWFLKHIMDKYAHSIDIPEGIDKPVTVGMCNQRFMEHEKARIRQDEERKRLEEKVDRLLEIAIRLETLSKE